MFWLIRQLDWYIDCWLCISPIGQRFAHIHSWYGRLAFNNQKTFITARLIGPYQTQQQINIESGDELILGKQEPYSTVQPFGAASRQNMCHINSN